MGHRFAVALLGLFGLCLGVALAQPTQPAGLPPAPKVTDVRLYVLDCGTIISHEPERFGLSRSDVPDPDFADPCFLVVHPKGMLLFDTGLTDAAPAEQRELFASRVPMGRMGRPEELAELVAWLSSDRCSFSTGAAFDVSGGRAVY